METIAIRFPVSKPQKSSLVAITSFESRRETVETTTRNVYKVESRGYLEK